MEKEITILEDDQDIREICTYVFTSEGYKVNSYENISDFMASRSIPDLYLLDIKLPDGSGLDVCRQLKADPILMQTPVIMMSAHLDRSTVKEHCNAEEFIEKPFQIAELLAIAEVLISKSK